MRRARVYVQAEDRPSFWAIQLFEQEMVTVHGNPETGFTRRVIANATEKDVAREIMRLEPGYQFTGAANIDDITDITPLGDIYWEVDGADPEPLIRTLRSVCAEFSRHPTLGRFELLNDGLWLGEFGMPWGIGLSKRYPSSISEKGKGASLIEARVISALPLLTVLAIARVPGSVIIFVNDKGAPVGASYQDLDACFDGYVIRESILNNIASSLYLYLPRIDWGKIATGITL